MIPSLRQCVATVFAVCALTMLHPSFAAKTSTPAQVTAMLADTGHLGYYMSLLWNKCPPIPGSTGPGRVPGGTNLFDFERLRNVDMQPNDAGTIYILYVANCDFIPDWGFPFWVELVNNRTQGIVIDNKSYRVHMDYVGSNHIQTNSTWHNMQAVVVNQTGQYYDMIVGQNLGNLWQIKEYVERFIKRPLCWGAGASSSYYWNMSPLFATYGNLRTPADISKIAHDTMSAYGLIASPNMFGTYGSALLPFWSFGTMVSSSGYTTSFLQIMRATYGLKTVYFMYENWSAYAPVFGPASEGGISDAKKLNYTIVGVRTVQWDRGNNSYANYIGAGGVGFMQENKRDVLGDTKWVAHLQPFFDEAIGNKTEVLCIYADVNMLFSFIEAVRATGYNFKAIFVTAARDEPLFIRYGEPTNFGFIPTQWTPVQFFLDDSGLFPNGGSLEFVTKFQETYGGFTPNYGHTPQFICGHIFMNAVKQMTTAEWTGPTTAKYAKLQRLFADTVIDNSIFGPILFNRYNQNIGKTANLEQVQNGKIVALSPVAAATGYPIVPTPTWESRYGCPPGTYNTGFNCTACPANTYTDVVQTPNKVGVCTPCPLGTGSTPGSSSCTPCGQGTYAPLPGTGCLSCPLGKATTLSGQSACQDCLAGTYADVTGLTTCKKCPAGNATSATGQSSCTPCIPGFYANSTGMSTCMRCDIGTFQPVEGQATCNTCNTSFTTNFFAATSPDDCTCAKGFYLDFVNNVCLPCQEGAVCAGGKSIPTLMSGFYAPAVTSNKTFTGLSIYKCMVAKACPGGEAGKCLNGRTGLGCAQCPVGYYESDRLRAECKLCGDAATSEETAIAQSRLVFSLFIGLLGLPYLIYKALDSPMTAKAGPTVVLSITVNNLLGTAQTLLVWSSFAIEWPDTMKGLFNSIQFSILDFNAFKVACAVGSNDPAPMYTGWLALPLILGASFFYWWITSIPTCWLIKNKLGFKPVKPIPADKARLMPASEVIKNKILVWWTGPPFNLYKTLNAYMNVLSALYIIIVNNSIALFVCYKHPNGVYTTRKWNDLVCYSDKWNELLPIGVLAIIFYVAGIWLFFATLLFLAPRNFHRANFKAAVKFLVFRFRADRYWWAVVAMTRGLLMTLPAVIFPNAGWYQVLMSSMTMLTSAALTAAFWPWNDNRNNILDLACQLTLVLIMITVGLTMSTPRTEYQNLGYVTASVLFLICCAFAYVVVELLHEGYLSVTGRGKVLSLMSLRSQTKKLLKISAALSVLSHEDVQSFIKDLPLHDQTMLRRYATVIEFECLMSYGVTLAKSTRRSSRLIYSSQKADKSQAVIKALATSSAWQEDPNNPVPGDGKIAPSGDSKPPVNLKIDSQSTNFETKREEKPADTSKVAPLPPPLPPVPTTAPAPSKPSPREPASSSAAPALSGETGGKNDVKLIDVTDFETKAELDQAISSHMDDTADDGDAKVEAMPPSAAGINRDAPTIVKAHAIF